MNRWIRVVVLGKNEVQKVCCSNKGMYKGIDTGLNEFLFVFDVLYIR